MPLPIDRRSFLKTASAGLGAGLTVPAVASAAPAFRFQPDSPSDRVRVALSTRLLFGATSLTIPSKANGMLCSIAEAAPQAKLRVVAVTSDDEPPTAALAAKYGSRRELSAARAAIVSNRLEDACNVKSDRLEPVGWIQNGNDKAWGLKPPAVVIEVVPPAKE